MAPSLYRLSVARCLFEVPPVLFVLGDVELAPDEHARFRWNEAHDRPLLLRLLLLSLVSVVVPPVRLRLCTLAGRHERSQSVRDGLRRLKGEVPRNGVALWCEDVIGFVRRTRHGSGREPKNAERGE